MTAYPDGTKDSGGDRFWNATNACCNFDGSRGRRRRLPRQSDHRHRGRGDDRSAPHLYRRPSNGRFMSYRLGLRPRRDRIAAIVSLAGSTLRAVGRLPLRPSRSRSSRSTAPQTTRSRSRAARIRGFPYPGAEELAATWARYLDRGCSPRHPSPSGSTSMRPSRTRVSPPRRP